MARGRRVQLNLWEHVLRSKTIMDLAPNPSTSIQRQLHMIDGTRSREMGWVRADTAAQTVVSPVIVYI